VVLLTMNSPEKFIRFESNGVKILRTPDLPEKYQFFRWGTYIWFYLVVFFSLLKYRKHAIMYYESISALPVWFLHKIGLMGKRKLLIHFHEYFNEHEIAMQMKLERVGHRVEPDLFEKANWISQQNDDRIIFFKRDFPFISENILRTLPNYPPAKWLKFVDGSNNSIPGNSLKLVYVGSLSTRRMHTRDVFNWILDQKGDVTLDIYSINFREDVASLLKELNTPHIKFKGGLKYDEIPQVIKDYHVGLVLYNSESNNFIYNTPNKLFEYLACGLDVWCSKDLVSSRIYERNDCYPKVQIVDFTNLKMFNWRKAIDRTGLTHKASPFVMETVYNSLAETLVDKN
jgi:hypothetical protein